MQAKAIYPEDLRLVLHHSLSTAYGLSKVLAARAGFDGTLQLLSSGWERTFGYARGAIEGCTLRQLMWSDRCRTAAAVAVILDGGNMAPVDLRMRGRDGLARGLRLHRHYDAPERLMYIIAEEMAQAVRRGEVRRIAGDPA